MTNPDKPCALLLEDQADWWFGRRTRIEDVVQLIIDANRAGRGFAMIRLGDAEGRVLYAPDIRDADTRHTFRICFGDRAFAQDEVLVFNRMLVEACSTADMIGLPSVFQFRLLDAYQKIFAALAAAGLPRPDQALGDANLHWYLQFSGAYALILRDQPLVGLIGCRDLTTPLRTTFGIGEVRTWLVRGEHAFPGSQTEPHWPDAFERIMAELVVEQPGQIFLVGAGLLGKRYCSRIKQLGGVALDVGSMLDAWSNVDSRLRFPRVRHLFAMDRGSQAGLGSLREALTAACEEANVIEGVF